MSPAQPPLTRLLFRTTAGITYDAIEAAFVGYVFGASTCGQAALYQLGLTGIPITNVNNNCSTGSTALVHAATLVRASEARCALALGFERMAPGALGAGPPNATNNPWSDRPSPIGPIMAAAMQASPGADRGPPNPRLFGAAAAEYFKLYGGGVEHLAKIGEPLPTSHRCMLIMVIRGLGRFVS
jgi:sterol carrier protein 2